jgi:histone deacetylase complex regulatory component SIN3
MSPGAMPNRKHIYGHENLQDISNLAVTATASAHAGSSMLRPLNVTNALSYLDAVKTQFCNEPNVYDHFLDIMVDFKKEM